MKRRTLTIRSIDYVTINVYWFGIAFMWNALHPIVLPALLLRFVPESLKNTYLGGMTFAGLILAMVVQPLAGGLSDGTRSRWGRRRPWILVGTLLDLVFLVGMARTGIRTHDQYPLRPVGGALDDAMKLGDVHQLPRNRLADAVQDDQATVPCYCSGSL